MQARREDYNADNDSEDEYDYNNLETESDKETINENTKNSMIKEKEASIEENKANIYKTEEYADSQYEY